MRKWGTGLDSHQFRHVLGQFATGITVVFTLGDRGAHGMTVNSLTSVSLDPPLILFCVDRHARTWQAVKKGRPFTVNILADTQEPISRLFADPNTDDAVIKTLPHRLSDSGLPILDDALAFVDCTVESIYAGGDHDIVIGRVNALDTLTPGQPLLFFAGHYHRLQRPLD